MIKFSSGIQDVMIKNGKNDSFEQNSYYRTLSEYR